MWLSHLGAGPSVTAAQPASSIIEAVVSESELSVNREDQQESHFMDVDDPLEPMVLLAPDGGKITIFDLDFRLKYFVLGIISSIPISQHT